MNAFLPYGRQWVDKEDIAAVAAALADDLITQGPRVEEFEGRMAEFCGAPHAVAFSSGTAALHAAMFAAGIGPGDEVITTPLSFAASANCVVYQGGTPVFADVEARGFLLDPEQVEKKMSKRTRAVLPVDYAGHPADLERLGAVAAKNGALLIEDACHSLGARLRGRRIGSQADLTILSFHPVKHITTGEGGMVLTKRKSFHDRLLRFRTHGIVRPEGARRQNAGPWFYEMVDLGFNYRLTDFQCALGLSQMNRLEQFLARRAEIAETYDRAFEGMRHFRPLKTKPEVKSARHLYVVQIDFKSLGKSRIRVMEELKKRGVGTQVHYIPIHRHPFYREKFSHKKGDFPWAESFYSQALSLPLYPKLTDKEVGRVIDAVRGVMTAAKN